MDARSVQQTTSAAEARETSEAAFAPKIAGAADAAQWGRNVEKRIGTAFDAIGRTRTFEREQDRERASVLLSQRSDIVAAVRRLAKSGAGTLMTRIHGDFHLGQVLVASGDVYIIDFEGEPATSIAERRAKTSPLRDVAGLLRSIDYAGAALIERKGVGTVPIDETQRDRLIAEFRARASRHSSQTIGGARLRQQCDRARALLDLFLIEKAAYEITYEAANRPTWIGVPLAGLFIAGRAHSREEDAGGRNG